MSLGKRLVKSLKDFVHDLRTGKPLKITRIIRQDDGSFKVIEGTTDDPKNVKVRIIPDE